MTEIPEWQYDEMRQAGVDYADASVVAKYDEHHRRFRDYEKSAEDIIAALRLRPEHTVIDMGCGTGAFVLHAAPRCKKVYAVDVSAAMLEYLKKKGEKGNLSNIEYHQAGFLTYEHRDEPVDAVVSVAALHHLPDFWKLVGLSRVADMLKPGGSLCLFDMVYSCNAREHKAAFDQWVSSTESGLGKEFADETVIHIRDEYSTCDWILEGMLERASFTIKEKRTLKTMPGTTYICMKKEF
jgi:putative AdoMet-dependent methyltransferase